jgi:cytosol alanyl aminopeptidase
MRKAAQILAHVALGVLAGCGAEAPVVTTPPPPVVLAAADRPDAPPATRDDGRLPKLVRPIRYDVALDVDPRKERFHGEVLLALEVTQRTFHVVMHAHDLTIARAVIAVDGGGAPMPATVATRAANGSTTNEELVLSFPRALEAGQTATLTLAYDAPFGADLTGLYRTRDGDRWYAYTDFEPTDARKMLPCLDEPIFKAPFDVKVTVPKGMLAIGNAKEASRKDEEPATTTFRFATTKPLPTYLLAIAVGDFDLREGGTAAVPMRVVAPKGKGDMAQLALDAALGVTQALESYLKVPFPFPKLDLVAVPEFASGAMENAGLITFRQELLLVDTRHASTRARRSLATLMAHEVAHQWFGDLVTAEWWNDLWLNEAMATWLQSRIVHAWQPQLGTKDDLVSSGLGVMDQDGLASARAVRQPVRSVAEAREAFDGITYTKGAAVLAMIEQWVGAEAFQASLHDYLEAHAYKNATAASLLGTLDHKTRLDVTAVADSFLNRPGVPILTAHLECEPGRWHVELQQEAWRPLGSAAADTQQTWSHPVCLRAEGRKEPSCTVLAGGAPSLIAGTGRCPAWVLPNEHSAGYYRFTEAAPELLALGRAMPAQAPVDRLSFVSNAWAAARAGLVGPDQLLKLLPAFDKESDRSVVDAVVGVLSGLDDTVVDDDVRPQFRAYVAARLSVQKAAVGWAPAAAPKEDESRPFLRRTLLFAMADLAGDAATLREAEPLAQAWLKDAGSVDPDIAPIAVELASRGAGEERLAALRDAAKRARTPEDRIVALRGMASFDEPQVLEHALDLLFTDEIKPAEARYLLGTASNRRATRPVVRKWVEARWDKLRAKLPGQLSRGLFFAAGLACTRAEKEASAAFFGPRAAAVEGAARPLAVALESASVCAEQKARGTEPARKALRKTGTKP